MPSYFYHLKFELYPTPQPNAPEEKAVKTADSTHIWLPTRNCGIFDELPVHTRGFVPTPSQNQARISKPFADINNPPQPSLIDCGAPRPPTIEDTRNIVVLSERQERQLRQRTLSVPPPQSYAAIKPETAARDWRFDRLSIESLDVGVGNMAPDSSSSAGPAIGAVGPSMSTAGKATKAKYVPLKTKNTNIGWGIVHLYREGEETPGLGNPHGSPDELEGDLEQQKGLDCTTVCIPAVPSYLTASDFLGFIGERWRDQVTHYRMVMTGRMNRYLVLMKFRDSKYAQLFKREFDGKVFNHIEPETCNVAFIRSISFETPSQGNGSFPVLSSDPFTPASATTTGPLKPFPPPTPDLVELPTCPVCLERMDDTTGLLTIPCQHVFHCSCLQKWKGSGCPVCRHTNPSLTIANSQSSPSSQQYDPSSPFTQPFGEGPVSNFCSVCDCPDDLWICLICGNVGCGRYKGGHAKEHWKDTAHTFSLELDTQHVWDYAGDIWVHRLIREKGDGKLVELPGHHGNREDEDVVPRAKLDSIGMEYTHLLISQLESQRVYFEEMLSKAADKLAKTSAIAEQASMQSTKAIEELHGLKEEHQSLSTETIPSLEKDLARERSRANKATELARGLSKSLQEEKKVSEGLMARIEHVNKDLRTLGEQVKKLELENADLKDQNHDLTMFISGQEKLKEMQAEGQIEHAELEEGSASVPESRRRKGKGKAKS